MSKKSPTKIIQGLVSTPNQTEDQHFENFLSFEAYENRINEIDAILKEQLSSSNELLKQAFRISVVGYIWGLIICVLLLIFGIYLGYTNLSNPTNQTVLYISLVIILISVIGLLAQINNNPAKNIQQQMNRLLKINMMMSAYSRQISQIDIAFRQTYVMKDNVAYKELAMLFAQMIDEVDNFFLELGNI